MLPILLFFIPIKFVVNPTSLNKDDEFYIIKFIPETSTDSGCYVIGDQNDLLCLTNNFRVKLTGEDPRNYITSSIHDYNKFIIYGSLEKNEFGYNTLNSSGWDFFGKIKTGGTHKNFITIYDLDRVASIFDYE